jgi:hypothetical protein
VCQWHLLLQIDLPCHVLRSIRCVGAKEVWKIKAPNKFWFFMWLAIHDHCWTSDRLHKHGMRSDCYCALCNQLPERANHLLFAYVVSREVWFKCLQRSAWQHLSSTADDDDLVNWWLHRRKQVTKARRKAFNSMCTLIARIIWLHHNEIVFRVVVVSVTRVIDDIVSQMEQWCRDGIMSRSQVLGE